MGNSEVGHNALGELLEGWVGGGTRRRERDRGVALGGRAWAPRRWPLVFSFSPRLSLCSGSGQVIDQGARLVDIALEKGTAFEGDGWK